MVGNGLENPAIALLGLGKVVAVFVHDAEIQQRPQRCRVSVKGPLVAGLRLVVVAGAIVEDTECKQGVRMAWVDGDRLFKCLGHLAGGAAAVGQDRPLRSPIVGGLVGRIAILARCHGIDGLVGLVEIASSPQGLCCRRAADNGVVARLFRRFKRLLRLVECLQSDVGKTLMVESQRAAVGGSQRVESLAVAAQQILADAEPHRRGRTAVARLLQFADRCPHVTMGGGIAAEGLGETADFSRAEWSRAGDEFANIESSGSNLCGGDHERPFALEASVGSR